LGLLFIGSLADRPGTFFVPSYSIGDIRYVVVVGCFRVEYVFNMEYTKGEEKILRDAQDFKKNE
jgi:hypothetical protein